MSDYCEMAAPSESIRPNLAVLVWAILGFSVVLIKAIVGLAPLALEPIREDMLSTGQIALYVGWVIFMAYSEGYKGFQKQLAPRFAARGLYASRNPRPALVILAPLFCMGLFHANRRRLIVAWTILIGVIVLVIGVRQLDQPWRGIVDGGVVIGLAWGQLAMLYYAALALIGRPYPVSLDLPDDAD